jgi:hypothetical protein
MGKGAGTCSGRPSLMFAGEDTNDAVEAIPAMTQQVLDALAAGQTITELVRAAKQAHDDDEEWVPAYDMLVRMGLLHRSQGWHDNGPATPSYTETQHCKRYQALGAWERLDIEAQIILSWLDTKRSSIYAQSVTDVSAGTGAPFPETKGLLEELVEVGFVEWKSSGQYRGYRISPTGVTTLRCGTAPPPSLEPGVPLPVHDFTPVPGTVSEEDRAILWKRVSTGGGPVAQFRDGKVDVRLDALAAEGLFYKWGHQTIKRNGAGYDQYVSTSYYLAEAGRALAMQRYRREHSVAEDTLLHTFAAIKTPAASVQSLRQHAQLKMATGIPAAELTAALAALVKAGILERRQQMDYYTSKRRNGWGLTPHGKQYVEHCLDA